MASFVVEKLDNFIASKRIPNIIFHGSSGSGKRTIVGDFIYRIYHGDRLRVKTYVMFVNCAHGKGIKFIREELKHFSKTNVQCNDNNLFKSIVLYNADELTIDAQSALRRCIELFSNNTRFFIVVENKYKLLKPILSRFCEIYVPDNNIAGGPHEAPNYKSLHIIKNNAVYGDIGNTHREHAIRHIAEIVGTDIDTLNHLQFIDIADRLYEDGISCLDILDFLETIVDNARLVKLRFCYNKIKGEFRSEKMLMLYLFDFLYLRSNTDLKNISFL
jgi:DNA polymerase III delta prime subunit